MDSHVDSGEGVPAVGVEGAEPGVVVGEGGVEIVDAGDGFLKDGGGLLKGGEDVRAGAGFGFDVLGADFEIR